MTAKIVLGTDHINAARSTLHIVLILVGLIGILIELGGIYLGFSATLADTKFHVFGISLTSTSVGVSIMGIGAILIIVLVRNVLYTLTILAKIN